LLSDQVEATRTRSATLAGSLMLSLPVAIPRCSRAPCQRIVRDLGIALAEKRLKVVALDHFIGLRVRSGLHDIC
jgi:hypothetical protein